MKGVDQMDKRKFHFEYLVRVSGRPFEVSPDVTRRDEIIQLLKGLYPDCEITYERRRKYDR